MENLLLGFDIGGTKCAVCLGECKDNTLRILTKQAIPTDLTISPEAMLTHLMALADDLLNGEKPVAVGVSCGGPLSSAEGIILGPPNLPGWDHVAVVELLQAHYGVPTALRNDADAGALAE